MYTTPPVFPGHPRKNDDIFIRAALSDKPYIYIYEQQDIEIVYGPSFCEDKEIFADRCAKDGVAAVERRGGGGTVVLSPGVLVIIAVGEKKNEREGALDIFRRIHDCIIAALNKAGIADVIREGISDLAVRGKKILGSSLYMGSKPPLFYYQSSLMVSCDISLMDRYLRHPPREPEYRKGRGHSRFCTTLKELGAQIDMEILKELIESYLKKGLITA